ncbi:class I SAM-dependent methyltransferase [Streptoalloteichus hindustanus]|uniref:Methyltransferase domain-containing protein n=1 Tax=Streptoalloteichus hindustanus TaxID=2017 RepID=A0A1M5NG46_STRHI|nr:class I SAM-dependent methyltransferase [Streptoalloteichus hindustanus]SHG87933.1 Methyltransferase domain-containing protein [Streptoalloteichus hindustanus]
MSEADRERLRATFTEDAELYDRCRPTYPPALFDDLAALVPLTPASRVLEIGCGTGQATLPLARLGCAVTAVELGAEMAAVARRKLVPFPSVRFEVTSFEEWPLPAEGFDLVLAATSFHWVDPAVRTAKAADALRPDGALAVISTHHVAGGTAAFFVDVQEFYERFMPGTSPNLRLTAADDIPRDSGEFDQSGRFGPVRFLRYEWEQLYTTSEYLDLLFTYSNHRALSATARQALFSDIRRLIDDNHGGRITKRYLTEFALAHRAQ